MELVFPESIGELLALIGSAIGTFVFTLGGILVEQAALESVLTGEIVIGAWEAWMGTAVLFLGIYLLGYRNLLPRLRQLRQPINE